MNVTVQRYAPPAVVIAIAFYLGWPAAPPMDLGEQVVRAKSVRWKTTDLRRPTLPASSDQDPFAAVLIDSQASPTDPLIPSIGSQGETTTGPTENDLRLGLKLAGIATTDQHRWAIVNNRVCRPGDRVDVVGLVDVSAEIRNIATDHITVAVDGLIATIHPQGRKTSQDDDDAEVRPKATEPAATESKDEDQDEDEIHRTR